MPLRILFRTSLSITRLFQEPDNPFPVLGPSGLKGDSGQVFDLDDLGLDVAVSQRRGVCHGLTDKGIVGRNELDGKALDQEGLGLIGVTAAGGQIRRSGRARPTPP